MRIRKILSSVLSKPILKKHDDPVKKTDLLSTGSTLLNLAISDDPAGGFAKGRYFYLVGDSASGKTFLSMTCLAEAARNSEFKGYRFIYDNVEDGMLMDVDNLFGREVARRLEPPAKTKKGIPIFSETIEDFYFHFDDLVKEGQPFIYVLDSMDGLSSEAEKEKFEEQKKAARKGKEISGSYGDGKAKKNSTFLRRCLSGLRKTGSILIIISQTRDNLNASWGETKTRSGGKALRFYATVEIWSSIVGQIAKNIRGKKRKVGHYIQLQLKKNRITGKNNTVTTSIFPSYGIDDLGSCVDFLVSEGFWPKKKGAGMIDAKGLGITATREKIVAQCDGNEKKAEQLAEIVGEAWRELQAELALKRNRRYS